MSSHPVGFIRRVGSAQQLVQLIAPNFRLLTGVVGLHGAAAAVSSLDFQSAAYTATSSADTHPPSKALASPARFLAELANSWRVGAILLAPNPHAAHCGDATALVHSDTQQLTAFVADQILRDALFHGVSGLAVLQADTPLPKDQLGAVAGTDTMPSARTAEVLQTHALASVDLTRHGPDRVRDVRGILAMDRSQLRRLRPSPSQVRDLKKRRRRATPATAPANLDESSPYGGIVD